MPAVDQVLSLRVLYCSTRKTPLPCARASPPVWGSRIRRASGRDSPRSEPVRWTCEIQARIW